MTIEDRLGVPPAPQEPSYGKSLYPAAPIRINANAIERMHPRQRTELFSLAGVILDEMVNRALKEKRLSDNVGLYTLRQGNEMWGENPDEVYYQELYVDDLETAVDLFETTKDGLYNAIQIQGNELMHNLSKENGSEADPKIKKAYDRLTMIAARTGINIETFILEDSYLFLLITEMSGFAQRLAEPFLTDPDGGFIDHATRKDYVRSAKTALPSLLEKLPHDCPIPGVNATEQLWAWYIDLVSKYAYLYPED